MPWWEIILIGFGIVVAIPSIGALVVIIALARAQERGENPFR